MLALAARAASRIRSHSVRPEEKLRDRIAESDAPWRIASRGDKYVLDDICGVRAPSHGQPDGARSVTVTGWYQDYFSHRRIDAAETHPYNLPQRMFRLLLILGGLIF